MAAKIQTKYTTEIGDLKNKAGLTYSELKTLLGCSRNYVWMLCAGVRPCPLDIREALVAIAHDAAVSPYIKEQPLNDLFYWQNRYAALVDKYGTDDYNTWVNE